MTYESFISRRGFVADPFATTDSECAERPSGYFVSRPYFAGVMGTATSPEPYTDVIGDKRAEIIVAVMSKRPDANNDRA